MRDFVENDKIIKINWAIEGDKPKTSAAYNVLKAANIDVAREKIIILLPIHDVLMNASLRNIPNVKVLFFDQVNCFDLAKCNRVVFFEKDLHSFKEMVSKWI
jgi:ribosomal protein L4